MLQRPTPSLLAELFRSLSRTDFRVYGDFDQARFCGFVREAPVLRPLILRRPLRLPPSDRLSHHLMMITALLQKSFTFAQDLN